MDDTAVWTSSRDLPIARSRRRDMGGAGRILSLTVQKQNQLEMERGKITPTSESSMEPLFRIFAVDHAPVSHVPTWAQEV